MKTYLNILPEEKKRQLRTKRIVKRLLQQEIALTILVMFFWALLGGIFGGLVYQKIILDKTASLTMQTQEGYEDLQKYEKNLSAANAQAKMAQYLLSSQRSWVPLFESLNEVVPRDITIEGLDLSLKEAIIYGKANSREALLTFERQIEQSDCFEEIDVPLSSLVQRDDIDFQMDAIPVYECRK